MEIKYVKGNYVTYLTLSKKLATGAEYIKEIKLEIPWYIPEDFHGVQVMFQGVMQDYLNKGYSVYCTSRGVQ